MLLSLSALLSSALLLSRRGCARMSTAPAPSAATCFCGSVSILITPGAEPIGTSMCHCKICRTLSGAPMMANVLFSRDAASLQSAEGTEGTVTVTTQTSKAVVRHRCGKCWSPVFAELGPKRAVVPAALFSPLPPAWKPSHHIYYDSRVVDIPDGTPKWRGRYGGEACGDYGDDIKPSA